MGRIEVEFGKKINNFNVVREADRSHRREYLAGVAVLGAFILVLLFYGWQHYQWIQLGYSIEAEQKKKDQQVELGRQLRLERARLRSPERIDRIARRQLGMVLPEPGQLVTLAADAPLAIPGPPPPAVMAARQD